jgi:hypothetical protein
MERCTAPLRMLGSTPTELESQLNKELEAIVWMRLGAPPLLHSSKGKLNADPFALRTCPNPNPNPAEQGAGGDRVDAAGRASAAA